LVHKNLLNADRKDYHLKIAFPRKKTIDIEADDIQTNADDKTMDISG